MICFVTEKWAEFVSLFVCFVVYLLLVVWGLLLLVVVFLGENIIIVR